VKITSGDIITRAPVRLSLRSLFSTTAGKCLISRTLHYVSVSLLFPSHSNAFSLYKQPSFKIKYSISKSVLRGTENLNILTVK